MYLKEGINRINKTKEYDFKEAWDGLLNNSIATSVVTKISYKCTNEMLSKWYITENVNI